MQIPTIIALLWYIPVVTVTGIVHLFIDRWRSYGTKSYYPLYGVGVLLCLGTAAAMPFFLSLKVSMPAWLSVLGIVLLPCGLGFLFWSYKTLSFKTLAWLPELTYDSCEAGDPVRSGPYGLCRHPVYSAATLIMLSAFLMSGVVTLAAPLAMLLALTLAEDDELRSRFGSAYEEYAEQTPILLWPKALRPSEESSGE